MGAPLISNLGFTEVNSAGSLNTKAGAKINLPIQLYKLTGNVSGQLTLDSTTNHKKVILDTNGFDIDNGSDAPLDMDTPGGTTVELKGTGAIRATGKTTTITQGDTSHTGTTSAAAALGGDANASITVDTNHTYTETQINDIRPDPGNSYGSGGGVSWNDNFSTTVAYPPNGGSNRSGVRANQTYHNTSTATKFGGPGLDNVIRSDFSMTFTHAFVEDGNRTDGPITGVGGSFPPTTNTTHTYSGATYRFCRWFSAFQRVNNGNAGSTGVAIYVNANNGNAIVELENGRPSFCQIRDVKCFSTETGRKFTFTNNTDHTVTMGGTNNPVSGSSVAAGGALTGTRNSEDGSYNITATLPNTDGGGNPLAIHDLNKGTALLDSSQHTGITSVKGF